MIIEKELLHENGPAPENPVDSIEQSLNLGVLSQHVRTSDCEDQDFIPFNSKTSRWLIYSLLTQNNVRRLLSSVAPQFILTKCFQIPDSPQVLNQTFTFEKPAFSRHSDIFLTTIGVTIYAKLNTALETIIKHLVRHVYHSDICAAVSKTGFVRNACKSMKDTYVDAFNIATLSILRGNIDGLLLLMEYGLYDPQDEFTLIQWNSHFETVSYYRDILDFCVYQLRHLPCLPISSILGQMVRFTNRRFRDCRHERPCAEHCVGYDVTVFDVLVTANQSKEDQSIFRRTLLTVFEDSYFANEVAASILSVLEIIQRTAFYAQCTSHKIVTYRELHEKRFRPVIKTEKSLPSLTLTKLNFRKILTSDAMQSVALLLLWYENTSLVHGEDNMKAVRILTLMTRILLDIGQITILFENSDKDLCDYFTKLVHQNVTKHNFAKLLGSSSIHNLRSKMCDTISKNVPLSKKFISQCKASPKDMLRTRNLKVTNHKEGVRVQFTGCKGTDRIRASSYLRLANATERSATANNSNFAGKKIFFHESGFLRKNQRRNISSRNGYFPPAQPLSAELERPPRDTTLDVPVLAEANLHAFNHTRQMFCNAPFKGRSLQREDDEAMIIISSGFSDFINDAESRNTPLECQNVVIGGGVNASGDSLENERFLVSDSDLRLTSSKSSGPENYIPRLELHSSSDEDNDELTNFPTEISVCSRSPCSSSFDD